MKDEIFSATDLLQRIAALPYNHFFLSDVSQFKAKYQISSDMKETENRLRYFYLLIDRRYLLESVHECKRLKNSPERLSGNTIGDFNGHIKYLEKEILRCEEDIISLRISTAGLGLTNKENIDKNTVKHYDLPPEKESSYNVSKTGQ